MSNQALIQMHDPRYAQYAQRTVHLFDGQIVEEEDESTRAAHEKQLEESGFDVH